MRGLMILGVVCASSACSIRAVTFLPIDAADTDGRDAGALVDAGKDIIAADVARDVAAEVAADVAADIPPEAPADTPPEAARDVGVEAPVDQASEAAVDMAADAPDDGSHDAPDDTSVPVCGNRVREGNEECDDGMDDTPTCNGSSAGSLGCQAPRCGDEYTNHAAGEDCDTGIPDDTSTCVGSAADPAHACKMSQCGDGYVNKAALETCDDGNTSACGTCSADCSASQPGRDCPGGTGCVSSEDCGGQCATGNICTLPP